MCETLSVTFPVSLTPSGDMYICFDLTKEEFDQLIEAEESGEEFCEVDSLQELYNKILDVTYDEIANYIYDNQNVIDTYLGGKYDFVQARRYALSAYDISIGYPSIEE